MTDSARIRELQGQIDRLRAEIGAVESGVLPVVEKRGGVTPAQLAEALGFTVQNANNKLSKMLKVGLLDREMRLLDGGGREFIYRLSVPEREETPDGDE